MTHARQVLTSSGTDTWRTPEEVVSYVIERFGGIALDAAADLDNAITHPHLTIEDDALSMCWEEFLRDGWNCPDAWPSFCNPPYSQAAGGLEAWTGAMYRNSRGPRPVVGLFPARTETAAWRRYVMRAWGVLFIEGRLCHGHPDTGETMGPATFPSVLVTWKPGHEGPPRFGTLDLDPWRRQPPEPDTTGQVGLFEEENDETR